MEVKFTIDPESDSVVDIVAKQHLDTMSMVEEFMLLANVTAAKETFGTFRGQVIDSFTNTVPSSF